MKFAAASYQSSRRTQAGASYNVTRDDGLPIPMTPSFTLNAIVRQVYSWMVNILALYNVQPAITGSRINHEIDVYNDVSCLVLLGTPPHTLN